MAQEIVFLSVHLQNNNQITRYAHYFNGNCSGLGTPISFNIEDCCPNFSANVDANPFEMCPGETSILEVVEVLNGTQPYEYEWEDGSSNSTLEVNQTGITYNVTVTDANLCEFVTGASVAPSSDCSIDCAIAPVIDRVFCHETDETQWCIEFRILSNGDDCGNSWTSNLGDGTYGTATIFCFPLGTNADFIVEDIQHSDISTEVFSSRLYRS